MGFLNSPQQFCFTSLHSFSKQVGIAYTELSHIKVKRMCSSLNETTLLQISVLTKSVSSNLNNITDLIKHCSGILVQSGPAGVYK